MKFAAQCQQYLEEKNVNSSFTDTIKLSKLNLNCVKPNQAY